MSISEDYKKRIKIKLATLDLKKIKNRETFLKYFKKRNGRKKLTK